LTKGPEANLQKNKAFTIATYILEEREKKREERIPLVRKKKKGERQ